MTIQVFLFLQQQLITTKEELEHQAQQIAAYELHISQLTQEFEALSSSLQEKEATVALLEDKLPSCQKAASTPEQLSDVITLTVEIVELKQKLKEAEFQKQQNISEKDAAVQEMEAKRKVEMQLHRRLGKDLNKCKTFMHALRVYITSLFLFTIDEPPKITDHPKSLKDAVPDKPVTFTIQATGETSECATLTVGELNLNTLVHARKQQLIGKPAIASHVTVASPTK